MGKGLVTLCLVSGLASSVFGASPSDLNNILTSGTNASLTYTNAGVISKGTRDYILKEGFRMQVIATKYGSISNSEREDLDQKKRLEYVISSQDTNTVINMVDNGADGLSIGDTMNLTHNFSSGHKLLLKAEYPKEYQLRVSAEVYLNGKLVSQETKDTSKTLNIPLIKQVFIDPVIVGPEINKRFENGNEIYFGCINDIISGKSPDDFPCKEISEVFTSLDGKISKTRESKIANIAISGLSKGLSSGFNNLIARNKEKKEKSHDHDTELAKK